MRVLGLDPGSRSLGYGLLERTGSSWVHIASGAVHFPSREALPRRLAAIHSACSSLLTEYRPDLVVVEECFVARSPKAALVLGQVRGVLLLCVEQAGIPSVEYAARAVKLAAVGHGGAAKEQVQYMVPRLLRDCPACLQPDQADALAIAWCGAIHRADARGESGGAARAATPGERA
jgi:crossover junction endodeoxyribonuclease RuvC